MNESVEEWLLKMKTAWFVYCQSCVCTDKASWPTLGPSTTSATQMHRRLCMADVVDLLQGVTPPSPYCLDPRHHHLWHFLKFSAQKHMLLIVMDQSVLPSGARCVKLCVDSQLKLMHAHSFSSDLEICTYDSVL